MRESVTVTYVLILLALELRILFEETFNYTLRGQSRWKEDYRLPRFKHPYLLADIDRICGNVGLQLNHTKAMLTKSGPVSEAPFLLNRTTISEFSS
ncbi:unnamed protein product [Heligmosomoides polygyrus]|uniref:Secreted protein n=1 Tax=Heligmosomoides polygyrus TaxID=6339 RepID=A0A183FU46_HELPZ|nr:unnamed protein product [Heligmosomoides polygyrus]